MATQAGEAFPRSRRIDQQVTFLPGGREILFGEESFSSDAKVVTGRAARWNLETDVLAQSYAGHLSGPSSLALGGTHFVTVGADRSLRYWDIAGPTQVTSRPVSGRPTPPESTPDPTQPRVLRDRFEHPRNVTCLAISLDGGWVATGCDDNIARIWRLDTGSPDPPDRRAHGADPRHRDLRGQEDGDDLQQRPVDPALGDRHGQADVPHRQQGADEEGMSASLDGRRIAIGLEKSLEFFNLETKNRKALTFSNGSPRRIALSPDGKRLILTRDADRFEVLSADTGEIVRSFAGHTGRVTAAVFAPDGKHVASAANDRTARLWEIETGRQVHLFEGIAGRRRPGGVAGTAAGVRRRVGDADSAVSVGQAAQQPKFAGAHAFDGGTER